jgi:hypothetical protein
MEFDSAQTVRDWLDLAVTPLPPPALQQQQQQQQPAAGTHAAPLSGGGAAGQAGGPALAPDGNGAIEAAGAAGAAAAHRLPGDVVAALAGEPALLDWVAGAAGSLLEAFLFVLYGGQADRLCGAGRQIVPCDPVRSPKLMNTPRRQFNLRYAVLGGRPLPGPGARAA